MSKSVKDDIKKGDYTLSEPENKMEVDSQLIGDFKKVASEIVESYGITKSGIFEILKSEQDPEIKNVID